jgi:excisionase family DNA binding protein
MEELLTPDEAAKLKGVTIAAIYAAVKENRLAHTRVLRRIGLRKPDVLAWTPRSYAGRPGTKGGRRKGIPMSAEAKARISESQKRRWRERESQHTV